MKLKVVKVIWMDAASTPRWTDPEEFENKTGLIPIVTVGMLMKKVDWSKESILIGLNFDGSFWGDVMAIPTVGIRSIKTIATIEV